MVGCCTVGVQRIWWTCLFFLAEAVGGNAPHGMKLRISKKFMRTNAEDVVGQYGDGKKNTSFPLVFWTLIFRMRHHLVKTKQKEIILHL